MKQTSLLEWFSRISVFAFFFPIFYNILGGSGAILVNGIIIVLAGILLINRFKKEISSQLTSDNRKVIISFLFVFLLLLLQIPLSMSSGALFHNFSIIIRDFYEIHRPILYALIFCLAYFSFRTYDDLLKLHTFFIYLFIGFAILGINQTFRFVDDITVLYTKDHNAMTRRLTAPFVNPYDYAFVMILFILYFFFRFIHRHWTNLFLFFFSVVLFVLTQSRSMTIGLAFAIGFLVPVAMVYSNRSALSRYRVSSGMMRYGLLSLIGVIAFVALLGYLLTNFSYLTKSFVEIIERGNLNSLDGATSIRKDQFEYAFELAMNNPITLVFGNGAAKAHMEFVESMYTYYIFRYGILGLMLYFVMPMVLGIKCAIQCLKQIDSRDRLYPMYLALLIWLICLPICAIGNNLTEQVRISFLYYSSLGILARSTVLLKDVNRARFL